MRSLEEAREEREAIRSALREMVRASEMWKGAARDLVAIERELGDTWGNVPQDIYYKRGSRDVLRDMIARALVEKEPAHDYFEVVSVLDEMTKKGRSR